MDSFNFFKTAINSLNTTGAVIESSKFLIKKILSFVDFETSNNIVEFGPGNGCVTRGILESMSKESKLVAFELNKIFYDETKRIFDPRFEVKNETAENIKDYFPDNSLDIVISGLPLAFFDIELKTAILQGAFKALKPNGKFIQYQYSLKEYKFTKSIFENTKISFTALNIPPAFVYCCTK